MQQSNRGWSQGGRAKPAADYEFRYGADLLPKESAAWPRFVLVTTPSAYRTARPFLAQEPLGIGHVTWLDSAHQAEVSRSLPDDAELVVGLGGGRALDVAKYVALDKDLPLIQVPSILSTGAIIHGFVGRWEGRETIGGKDEWPWVNCEYVLVDDDLVLAAPYYLNTAGLGDILCGYAGVAEWRWRASHGRVPPCDEETIASMIGYYEDLTRQFEATLDGKGELTADSVRNIMTSIQERDAKQLAHSDASSGDHPFWIALESANDHSWVHGELVALGATIIAWRCDEQPELLLDWLDRCKVRRRPDQMGIDRHQLQKGLEYVPHYMEQRNVDSILRHQPVTGADFDALWVFLHDH